MNQGTTWGCFNLIFRFVWGFFALKDAGIDWSPWNFLIQIFRYFRWWERPGVEDKELKVILRYFFSASRKTWSLWLLKSQTPLDSIKKNPSFIAKSPFNAESPNGNLWDGFFFMEIMLKKNPGISGWKSFLCLPKKSGLSQILPLEKWEKPQGSSYFYFYFFYCFSGRGL